MLSLLLWMTYGEWTDDFNKSLGYLGGPPLSAELSSGMRLAGIGYALNFVILIWAGMKIHIRAHWV